MHTIPDVTGLLLGHALALTRQQLINNNDAFLPFMKTAVTATWNATTANAKQQVKRGRRTGRLTGPLLEVPAKLTVLNMTVDSCTGGKCV
jgi:hypothetical protein